MSKWKVLVLALSIGAWSTTAKAATITFDQVVDGGSIAYGGAGGSMTGTAINMDVITGIDVPNPGVLQCVDCELNFMTGANTGEGPAFWSFAAGGTFVITGDAFDPITSTTVASGTLLSGIFFSANVIGGGAILTAIGSGPDDKNDDLLAFFGLSANTSFEFASANISGTNVVVGADGSFRGDVNEADVANFSTIPDGGMTMALLGLGLVGLGALRRKLL